MPTLRTRIQPTPEPALSGHPTTLEIGYRDGLTEQEYLDRGRGAFKLDLNRALDCDELEVISPEIEGHRVLAVGEIQGASKWGDRAYLHVVLLPNHPRVGATVEWPSRNPINYPS